jgi:hypothetical protein
MSNNDCKTAGVETNMHYADIISLKANADISARALSTSKATV